MKVFYGEKQVVENTGQTYPNLISPSARKPKELAQKLQGWPGIEFVEPNPLTIDDLKLAHLPSYVDGVMSLQVENGFGSKSQAVADSLPYTNGAMYDAASNGIRGDSFINELNCLFVGFWNSFCGRSFRANPDRYLPEQILDEVLHALRLVRSSKFVDTKKAD